MVDKTDKYKLLRNEENHIVFHGDEEHREYEIDVDVYDESIPKLSELIKVLKREDK